MFDPRASKFWQATIHSGLMDVESLTACLDAIEPTERDAPEHIVRRLARQAVRAKSLTFWQAQQLLAGRSSGYRVDRYLLLDLIGQGGMGRVYLARDTRLNRPVALKILSAERLSKPRAIARFEREARVGARLQHENLVRIYDFGESKGRRYLVMEYIEGKTIATLISEQGPMPPATAARLVRQVALGLDHAHRKGLIHRDVNPANILVTHDGTAKLADLGLAIAPAEEDRVTRDGAMVGTFDYIAPEQARNSRAADARSDIYSLGCTIYHMIAGRVPFPGPSLPEKLLGHQSIEPTPLCPMVGGLPEELSDIVQRMMKKRPDERYATPLQVALALGPFADDGSGAGKGECTPTLLEPLELAPTLLEPLELAPTPFLSDLTQRHKAEPAAALVSVAAAWAGLGPPPRMAANPDSGPCAVDSGAPLLTPDDDSDETDDEVRLILEPAPDLSLSDSQWRSESGSSTDSDAASADFPAGLIRRLARLWPWSRQK
jgi:serine/threonine protein kinase